MLNVVEIHCINETCTYLMKLVHEIGLELRSTAVCPLVRRIRYGHFRLMHALLMKHCDSKSIIENIEFCRNLVSEDVIAARPALLVKGDSQLEQLTMIDSGLHTEEFPN